MKHLRRFDARFLFFSVLLLPTSEAIGGDLHIGTSTHAVVAKANDFQITITDLGLLPGGTFASGLAINNQPLLVGLANDGNFCIPTPILGRVHRSNRGPGRERQSGEHSDPGTPQ